MSAPRLVNFARARHDYKTGMDVYDSLVPGLFIEQHIGSNQMPDSYVLVRPAVDVRHEVVSIRHEFPTLTKAKAAANEWAMRLLSKGENT